MKKKILVLFTALAAIMTLHAQQSGEPEPLGVDLKQEIIDSLISDYYDWDEISMSGKLSSPLLPLTASVKVYMKKGELVLLTVSAPLVGEAARIEIDRDQALVVNKLKNSYSLVEITEIEPILPGGLEAIQNLLLGRINILGEGQLNATDSKHIEIYDAGEDTFMFLPTQDLEDSPYVYFYTIGIEPPVLKRLAILTQDGEGEVNCLYSRTQKNLNIDFSTLLNGKPLSATLQLNNPDSKTKPVTRFEPSSKFRKTDLKGILK